MSDAESPNITSPSGAPEPSSAQRGDAMAVMNRADILRPVSATDVSLAVDPARSDVVTAQFWNGDHRAYGAFAQVTETAAVVTVEVMVGVLPEAEGLPSPAVAELQRLDIPLSSPLASRRLVSR